ncbi:hypothetical protein [Allosphingosinicella sp.]|jgi:hypothetical protein|uniref:hypothetical protein n=1 Tax=Allosphingosinicella sp. TaxID=2823234 RepID=UPI002F1BE9CB
MASKSFQDGRRHVERGAIDVPLAALAALAVAFALFAMPMDLVSRLIELSRLPDFFPAAAPPLGTKARAAISLIGAVAAFAAVLLLLRKLSAAPAEAPARRHEPDYDPPRQRRSDAHPDAPPRRPILAGRDFGEPGAKLQADPPPRPEPQPERYVEEPTPWTASEDELELGGPGTEMLVEAAEPEPEPEPEPRPEPVAARGTVAEPAPVHEKHSIPDLMLRLERALTRRRGEPAQQASRRPREEQPFAARGDDRLGSAIENLQRLASRAR